MKIVYIHREKLADWFRACVVAVSAYVDVPGLQANSPNKVFDAFAGGRPVAVNNGNWAGELLTESGAGMVLPPGKPDAAADLPAQFLSSRASIDAGAATARALADNEFNRGISFAIHDRVLVDVLAERGLA